VWVDCTTGAAVTTLGILWLSAAMAGELSVAGILAKTEVFAFTDGSSVYSFHRDHRFELEPIGMSGRTVTGIWTATDSMLTITGEWGWANGLSAIDDFRELRLYVNPRDEPAIEVGHRKDKVSPVYFSVDRLVEVDKSTFEARKAALL
jgi:hypothetical protein